MKQYCERYDVYYDDYTGEYLEPRCPDPNCEYCKDRPMELKERCNGCHKELPSGHICQGLKTIRPYNKPYNDTE